MSPTNDNPSFSPNPPLLILSLWFYPFAAIVSLMKNMIFIVVRDIEEQQKPD